MNPTPVPPPPPNVRPANAVDALVQRAAAPSDECECPLRLHFIEVYDAFTCEQRCCDSDDCADQRRELLRQYGWSETSRTYDAEDELRDGLRHIMAEVEEQVVA